MPPSLHPHLKRAVASDDLYLCPQDVIEQPPLDRHGPEQQAAKRRRVEAIAAQYLRGRPPVILTAGLRGPFDNGWKNPWTKPAKTKHKPGQTGNARPKRSSKPRAVRDSPAHSIASPETSRAARDIHLSAQEHDNSLSNVQVAPSTAPLSDEDDVCTTTGSFSAHDRTRIRHQPCLTNPFWLRRLDSARVDRRKTANERSDPSPTRSRSRHANSQTKSVTELRTSFPKTPVHALKSPPKGTLPENWKSSASASMDISSPIDDDDGTKNGTDYAVQAACVSYSTEPAQRSQRTIPIVTSSMGSQTTVSRRDIQRSAERLANSMSGTAASNKSSQRSNQKASQKTHTSTQQDDVISPLPIPSLEFTHQETEQVNISSNKPSRPRPRAINFDSSPEKASPVTRKGHDKTYIVEDNEETEEDKDKENTAASQSAEITGLLVQDGELQRSHASRDSEWCTQAAIARAQLEFQQSTFPALSPATIPAESQVSLDTPRPILRVPDLATTPLTAVTVQRDEALANESVIRGPSISTQDLFGAASPFSFSTVKKKAGESQRSSLRLSMGLSDVGAPKPDDVTNNSPTPWAGRTPLKDKNTTSFWSFVSDKASQGSQRSLGERSRCLTRESEFPRLHRDTSLDDFGRHFAGTLVRGVEDG